MLDFLGDYDWWGGTLIFESRDSFRYESQKSKLPFNPAFFKCRSYFNHKTRSNNFKTKSES
jgi:hypothetical protein